MPLSRLLTEDRLILQRWFFPVFSKKDRLILQRWSFLVFLKEDRLILQRWSFLVLLKKDRLVLQRLSSFKGRSSDFSPMVLSRLFKII